MSPASLASPRIARSALDRLETAYRSVLSGQRICQLYCFMLLFEWLQKPFVLLNGLLVYGLTLLLAQVTPVVPGEAPSLDTLSTARTAVEFLFILNVWFIFAVYSDFRASYAALALCVVALGHNLYVAWATTVAGDPIATAGFGAGDLSAEAAAFGYSFMAGLAALHVYFLAIALRGQRTLHALEPGERRILSEYRPGASRPGATLRALVNIPGAIRYSSRKAITGVLMVIAGVANCTNYWRLSMAFLLVCILPLLWAAMFPQAGPAWNALLAGDRVGEALKVLGLSLLLFLLVALLLFSVPFYIKLLGRFAIRLAQRFMRTSLQRIQHEDPRPPVLFLRSFLNDQVALPARGRSLERWMLDATSASMTLDYLVLAEGTTVGPTVALGNPDDPAPPYGVARGYFTHDTWKEAVARLCRDAAAIVIVLDRTEGVRWEIGHIAAEAHAGKTLFLLAPGDVGTEGGAALLAGALAELTGSADAARDAPGAAVLGFEVIADDTIRLLTAERVSPYTYLVAVRRFLRGLADELPTGREETA